MKGAKGTEKEVKPEAPWGNSTFEAEAKEVKPTSEYSTTYYAKPANCKVSFALNCRVSTSFYRRNRCDRTRRDAASLAIQVSPWTVSPPMTMCSLRTLTVARLRRTGPMKMASSTRRARPAQWRPHTIVPLPRIASQLNAIFREMSPRRTKSLNQQWNKILIISKQRRKWCHIFPQVCRI